ncbi:MAG: metallophosphoesterase [Synergistaceae bacterium]|jgi:predicted MPP superfamily phosphohydrolase|nr:metallophosphoesterase [Synergistaceae bacterium]
MFMGIVLSIYILINTYLFARIFVTLSGFGLLRAVVCVIFAAFALSFPAAGIFRTSLPWLSDTLTVMGYLHIAPMIYGFILTLAADIFRALNSIIAITHNPPPFSPEVRLCSAAGIFAMSVIITLAGVWNASAPTVIHHDIEWDSPDGAGGPPLRIAVISDVHLGLMTGPGYLRKLVALTNEQQPDIILIAGDIVDSGGFFARKERMYESESVMSSFESRLGTWAVLGNHDYYAGAAQVTEFLFRSNVTLLKDRAAVLGGELILAGRDDLTVERYGGARKGIDEMIREAAAGSQVSGIPTVLMDHQPFFLEEAEKSGAALQVSGHTHRGQLFPVNFIVASIYEKHYGLYRRGSTNYYISSGAGVWGPPVRTIGRPEIVILNLRHKAKEVSDDE